MSQEFAEPSEHPLERSAAAKLLSLACVHGAVTGAVCSACGGCVVGGSGPDELRPGQVWRARELPHDEVEVLAVCKASDADVLLFVWHASRKGRTEWMETENFRDEFWFSGEVQP